MRERENESERQEEEGPTRTWVTSQQRRQRPTSRRLQGSSHIAATSSLFRERLMSN